MNAVDHSILTRVSRIARSEGVRGILRRVLYRGKRAFEFQYGYILVTPLIPLGPLPEPRAKVEVQRITTEDVLAIQDLSALYEQEYSISSAQRGILERLSRGEYCYISRVDGQVIGHLWVRATGAAANEYQQIKWYLKSDEVYFHDEYVAPEQRGKNIAPTLTAFAGRDMAERLGKKHSVGVVISTNRASLHLFRKLGAVNVGVLGHVKLFGKKLPFIFRHKARPV